MFVSEIKTIAEAAGLTFVYGSPLEVNQIIDKVLNDRANLPILVYLGAVEANDEIQANNLVYTSFDFNAMVLDVYDVHPDSIDYDSEEAQTTIDSMRDKARNIVFRINSSTIIREGSEGITEVTYPSLYGVYDAHLFGVGINCTIPADTGKTYCT